jgi:AraC-like DNA-binding protein
MKITHPQASYYDAFWGETSSGSDMPKYLSADFENDTRWYKQDGEYLITLNGLVLRYIAYDEDDTEGVEPVYNGAEVLTFADGLIMTISDFYCDPEPVDLIEIAESVEKLHSRANIAPLGLSARTSGRIKKRLSELAAEQTVFLNPSLTVTQLADLVGCSVMHLFHVLEEEKGTSFDEFVNDSRVRYATTLLVEKSYSDLELRAVARASGFEAIGDFRDAFHATFGVTPEEYSRKFA